MDAVYPATASALARGRRVRRAEPRHRHRTTPVTFAEIKEVDEESCEVEACEERCGGSAGGAGARRRPDVLEERLGPQFAEFRRRRAHKRDVLREREHESPPPARAASPPPPAASAPPPAASPPPPAPQRAGSEPAALHQRAGAADT